MELGTTIVLPELDRQALEYIPASASQQSTDLFSWGHVVTPLTLAFSDRECKWREFVYGC